MIKVNGKLKTRVIHGRNGDFTVANLSTGIGEFSVKDSTLDQYPEGEYQGEFVIQKIFPYSYSWGGSVKIEIRALLDSMEISEIEEKVIPAEVEPDPIDETPAQPEKNKTVPDNQVDHTPEPEKVEPISSNDLPEKVKLDPTGDRKAFRKERDRLKEQGYKFDAKTQFWYKQ